MKKQFIRFGAAIASVSLIATILSPAVFADTTLEISGNGEHSTNTIDVKTKCTNTVTQSNNTNVNTNVTVSSNTGGNTANSNTGGDVTIDTGAATSTLDVTVGGSSNIADQPSCCCKPDGNVTETISGNGDHSNNKIKTSDTQKSTIKQKNKTHVTTKGKVSSKTGNNQASGNTGGSVGITTDDATSSVTVTVDPSTNTL